jgi:hypothetical protein
MVMYYIYEIPGVKIGCTQDPKDRKRKQEGTYIILEQHEDIMVASSREIELQKEKGYPVDKSPYHEFVLRVKTTCNGTPNHIRAAKNNIAKSRECPIRKEKVRQAAKVQITCPHCGKTGSQVSMPRWHFDNCPKKETQLAYFVD